MTSVILSKSRKANYSHSCSYSLELQSPREDININYKILQDKFNEAEKRLILQEQKIYEQEEKLARQEEKNKMMEMEIKRVKAQLRRLANYFH